MEDILSVAYEESIKDMPCLVVFRTKNDKMEMINGVVGEKATELYNLLIRGNRNDRERINIENNRESK